MNRYPVAPLLHTIEHRYPEMADWDISETLGYSYEWLCRLRLKTTLTETAADRAAIALGLHPAHLWPSWFDDVPPEGQRDTCGSEKGAQAHRRHGEPVCLACRAADAERKRAWRRAQKAPAA